MSKTIRTAAASAAIGLLAAGLFAAPGCSGNANTPSPPQGSSTPTSTTASPSQNASHVIVAITGGAFDPSTVDISPGGRVVWSNRDKVDHVIKILPDGAESPKIPPNGSAAHVFPAAGTFQYTDPTHPTLKGTVVVR
jgi:plastocyanin